MDIELLKFIPEDEMEMMTMMQLDKLPDFCGIYSDDVSETPSMEYSHDSPTSNHQIMENSDHMGNINSSTLFNMPNSNILFTGSSSQGGAEMSFLSNSNYGTMWRSGGSTGNENIPTTPEQKRNSMVAMREMIFRIAAMQPIHIDPESVKPHKRRNVKISKDPQSVAARHRRERISERIRILQRLVPGGTKMDTASMLDEAIHYVKFLKNQVQSLERAAVNRPARSVTGIGFPAPMSSGSYMGMRTKGYDQEATQSVQHYLDA